MKLLLAFTIIALTNFSCSNERKTDSIKLEEPEIIYLDSECVNKMNEVFGKVEVFLNLPKFDSIKKWTPNLLPGYQDNEYHEQDYFFELISIDTIINVFLQIDPINLGEYYKHKLYFCKPIGNYWYINYFNNISSNFNFLENCGIKIAGFTNDTTTSYSALASSSALFNNWQLDSSTFEPKFKSILFLESDSLYTTIDGEQIKTKFNLYNGFLKTKDTSHFKLNCLILNQKELVIQDRLDSTSFNTYYLSTE